eukprot:TRINITY_DN31440_c0_g1_i3.p1 TRINITY_DN31440_c0_g1~~TRINITY_DN31440_c0_g1_i3.p1  ORF type:complete len:148 (+),score=40.14 TRINITY_DN31440_c0_g1_i3:64-444(+)
MRRQGGNAGSGHAAAAERARAPQHGPHCRAALDDGAMITFGDNTGGDMELSLDRIFVKDGIYRSDKYKHLKKGDEVRVKGADGVTWTGTVNNILESDDGGTLLIDKAGNGGTVYLNPGDTLVEATG